MQSLLLSALLALSATSDPAHPAAHPDRGLKADAPYGQYVEARTATVYAGACHYGSEYTTVGRAAVLGVHLEGGAHAGESLAGLEFVAVVRGKANLAEASAAPTSVLFVSADVTGAQRQALVGWATQTFGATLGRIAAVRTASVDVELAEDGGFRLTAGAGVELRGHGMPDRAGCTMPFGLWYQPFARVAQQRVGFAESFRVTLLDLGVRFERDEDNCAITGLLGRPAEAQG